MYRPTYISSSDPTVNDDFNAGFRNGNWWLNTTSNSFFMLSDASVGAAVWEDISTTSPFEAWGGWEPSYTWGGGVPTGVTEVARYATNGNTVFFTLQIDGNGGVTTNITDLTVTLPTDCEDNGSFVPVNIIAIIDSVLDKGYYAAIDSVNYSNGRLAHLSFNSIAPGEDFTLYYAGFYEKDNV